MRAYVSTCDVCGIEARHEAPRPDGWTHIKAMDYCQTCEAERQRFEPPTGYCSGCARSCRLCPDGATRQHKPCGRRPVIPAAAVQSAIGYWPRRRRSAKAEADWNVWAVVSGWAERYSDDQDVKDMHAAARALLKPHLTGTEAQ